MDFLEFHVHMLEIEPRIWRRFLLRRTLSFRALHLALQALAGWEDRHLFEFAEPGKRPRGRVVAGSPYDETPGVPLAGSVRLTSYFEEPGDQVIYRYDFGDDWECHVQLVGRGELSGRFERRLLEGERAFPPEDCGGVDGYWECVAAAGGDVPTAGTPPEWMEPDLAERRLWLGAWKPEVVIAKLKRTFDRD